MAKRSDPSTPVKTIKPAKTNKTKRLTNRDEARTYGSGSYSAEVVEGKYKLDKTIQVIPHAVRGDGSFSAPYSSGKSSKKVVKNPEFVSYGKVKPKGLLADKTVLVDSDTAEAVAWLNESLSDLAKNLQRMAVVASEIGPELRRIREGVSK